MPQNLRSLETRIREIARASVDKMAATGGRCDFVREVALHFPLHVVMEILGVPEADEPRMLTLTQELFGAADPELGRAASSDSDSIPTDTRKPFDVREIIARTAAEQPPRACCTALHERWVTTARNSEGHCAALQLHCSYAETAMKLRCRCAAATLQLRCSYAA